MSAQIKYLRLFFHLPDGGRQAIGHLSAYGDILRVSFDDAFIVDPQRATISLGFRGETEAATQAILRATRDRRLTSSDGRWPPFFQNLLPEGHNRDRLAKDRGCDKDDEFELLAAAGHDLMGALEVEPVPAQEGIPAEVRHWHAALGLDMVEPGFVEVPVQDAAALPGVVTKFSAVQDGRRYCVQRHGNAGSFILKLPSTRHPDLVDIEAAGFVLCKALDLDCAGHSVIRKEDAELPEHVPFEHILAVKRFDRRAEGRRIHMEEFAQVLGYTPRQKYGKSMLQDYGQMLRVLNHFSLRPHQDVAEFVNRFIAFILLGNTDAHLKNWALIYPDGRNPVLSPLYDPVSVSSFFAEAPERDYGINRAIDAKLAAFTWTDIEALLGHGGVVRPRELVRKGKQLVARAQEVWPELLKDAPAQMQQEVLRRLKGGVSLSSSQAG